MSTIPKKPAKRKSELDGKTWIQNSISIWSDIRKSKEELSLKHPALFPQMLVSRLLACFSWKEDMILDPFAGTGSTLLAARKMHRKAYGIELSQKFIELYQSRLKQKDLFSTNGLLEPIMKQGDCRKLLADLTPNSIQLTITSPPYWDILNRKRTADYKDIVNYSDGKEDIGNINNYQNFLTALTEVFQGVYKATKINGFCCVNVMDIRKKSKFYPLHIDTINILQTVGFELDDIIIWDRRQEYNNLRPLGYPYVFRVNKIHEFILIFKKHGA